MSFYEKSAWACLLSTLLVWGGYFALALTQPAEQSGNAIEAVVFAVILQAVVMIASHVVIGIIDRGDAIQDERDRLVALRSRSWASMILSLGVILCVVFFPMREIDLLSDPRGSLATGALAGPFTTGNLLLLCFVLSELVHYGAQVVLYRRN